MSRMSFMLTEDLEEYVLAHSEPLDEIAGDLIAETATLPNAGMQISPGHGEFLTVLVRLMGARSILEIGTFTGYSALCMARGLPPDGRLIACDVDVDWTNIARRYWERAGVADRIDLRLAPATETLAALPEDTMFDLVFIDADKPSYPEYFEATAKHLRSGGLLLADNVLWAGEVVAGTRVSKSTAALRRFNDLVVSDPRFETVLLPVFDGLTFARRLRANTDHRSIDLLERGSQ